MHLLLCGLGIARCSPFLNTGLRSLTGGITCLHPLENPDTPKNYAQQNGQNQEDFDKTIAFRPRHAAP